MESYNIADIANKLAIERINIEKQNINELNNQDNVELFNRINLLDSILLNFDSDKIDVAEQAKNHQFSKPWVKLTEANKIIKVNEFCQNHDIEDDIKNKLIDAVKHKLLNTKKQVIYNSDDAIIESIIFEKQIYK